MEIRSAPDSAFLFKPVCDIYGKRLALVFGNEFTNGECPFYTARQCSHCDIGAGEGKRFSFDLNAERLEFFKQYYMDVLPSVAHLVIYNSGSVLNLKEMSRDTLKNILTYASSLSNCRVISLDSREQFITNNSLEYLLANIRADQEPRVILGVESQSDEIRIGKLNKRMTKKDIELVFSVIGKYQGKIGVDVNIVFQAPELRGRAAIQDSINTLTYGLELGKKYDVSVDFNFHPYYPSKKSKEMYHLHPRANLQDAKTTLVKMKQEIDRFDHTSHIFVGWQDESHDQEQTTKQSELVREIDVFDNFNFSQRVSYLVS